MAINWFTGIHTALLTAPAIFAATKGIVEAVEEDGLAKAGRQKKQTALAVIDASLSTAGAFGPPAQVSPALRQGMLTFADSAIDIVVDYKHLVGAFSHSDAPDLAAPEAP